MKKYAALMGVVVVAMAAVSLTGGCGTKIVTVTKTVTPSPSPSVTALGASDFVGTWYDKPDGMYVIFTQTSSLSFQFKWINYDDSMVSGTASCDSPNSLRLTDSNDNRYTLISPLLLQAHYLNTSNGWVNALFTRVPTPVASASTSSL